MGLLKTAAKVAVASHVHGRVQRRQQLRWAAEDEAAGVRPPPAAAHGAAPGHDDMLYRLERLAALRASGVLTEEEFQQQKAAVLGS